MGSFNATCSITQHTICYGQEMYLQFMLPTNLTKDSSIGFVFVESFLNVVKKDGIEKAIETFTEATSTWAESGELSSKGMLVSNDGAYSKFVPFGPAIRGYYDDYGRIRPAEDEDSQNRVKILEGLMGGLPFSTIMEIGQDDRWYSLGLKKYANDDNQNTNWRPEGITSDMPEWLLILCKNLSLTYFHASVYDEMAKFDFACDEKCGVIKSKYSIKWKNEYLDPIKEKFPKILKNIKKVINNKSDKDDYVRMLDEKWETREALQNIGVFRSLNRDLGSIYQTCLARENTSLDWFYESLMFMYSMSGMCLSLDQSKYGSQHMNWFGWQRIYKALEPKVEKVLQKYGYDDEEDDEE